MARKGKTIKREVNPDPIYNSVVVTKLINSIMLDGKKSIAQKIVYDAFGIIKTKLPDEEPIDVFNKAKDNIVPTLEVKTRRIGGSNYQIPIEVSEVRRGILSIRWLTNYARLRSEKTMSERLAGEIIDAAKGTGTSVKKKEDTHKMAEANRAFAHYRW